MKVIVTGPTGMVGEGLLLECLAEAAVERVRAVSRRPWGLNRPKSSESFVSDFRELGALELQLEL